jgi:hypothetical protein
MPHMLHARLKGTAIVGPTFFQGRGGAGRLSHPSPSAPPAAWAHHHQHQQQHVVSCMGLQASDEQLRWEDNKRPTQLEEMVIALQQSLITMWFMAVM